MVILHVLHGEFPTGDDEAIAIFKENEDEIKKDYWAWSSVAQKFKCGDAMIFRNWVIYGTYRTAATTDVYSAIQVRIDGAAFD